MAGENTPTTLEGNFKKIYADKAEDLIPEFLWLQVDNNIDYVPDAKQTGDVYAVPTLLRSNQGVSYLGEGGDANTLEAAVNGVMKEAQIKGSEMVVRGTMSYGALSRASSQGPKAFMVASAWLVEDLARVAHTRLEIAALYGQTGLGVANVVTDLGGNSATISITDASWAPGIWVGAEGAKIDSFTGTTLNNSTGALTITSVNVATQTLTVTYAGTLTSESASGDILFFRNANAGAGVFREMCGLYKQLTATSGTLFNINRGLYSLMQGNVVSGVGAPTKAKVIDAVLVAVGKGLMANVVALVGTKAWGKLAAEDLALRNFDSSYSSQKSKSGSRALEYETVSGVLKVVCHPMVKFGEILIFDPTEVLWIGSTQPTFKIPSVEGEKFFKIVDGTTAVEFQNYCDLAIYHLRPGHTAVMTGLSYT